MCFLPDNIIGIWNTLQNITACYFYYGTYDIPRLVEEHLVSMTLLAQAAHTLVFILLIYLIHKHPIKISDKDCFLLAVVVFVCNLITICFEAIGMDFERQMLFLLLGIYGVVLFSVLVVFLFVSIYQHSLEEQKQSLELEILKHELSSNEKILTAQKQLQELRHDMKHFILALKEINRSSDAEKLTDVIRSYNQIDLNDPIPIKTCSSALDYIVNIKRDDALAKNIDFIMSINLTHGIEMEDDDLYLLMANLLDNAIEHIGIKKRIYLEICDVQKNLMVRIANSIDAHVLNREGQFIKHSRNGHGFGVETIRKILQKYSGFIHYTEREGDLISTALIPLSVICSEEKSTN